MAINEVKSSEISLTKEQVRETIEAYKKSGQLGNEMTIIVERASIQSMKDGTRNKYECKVVKPEESFNEMINPWTNKPWLLTFYNRKKFYKKGDILVGRYILQSNERNMHELIYPVVGSLKELPRSEELIERHGQDFVQFLQDKFDGEEALIGLMYERWSDTTENDMKQHNDIIQNLKDDMNSLDNRLQNKQTELKNINEEVRAQEKYKLHIEQQIHDIRASFGLIEENWEEETPHTLYHVNEDDDFFHIMQRGLYHRNDENLVYEYDIVKRFITALRTDQLVLLTGPSGTGKSSLVHQIGEVLHPCKVHHIAVQSNWTDVQDLLGFFNPLKNTYMPTPFLQALVDAKNDKDTLHIICLDEMNLAHVEYYFSSLLSAREKQPSKRFLDLYANKFYMEAKMDLEELLKKPYSQITSEDINRLDISTRREARSKYELTFDFPAHFPIPKNVRFVGTLNMDETVKPLSPKVVDRSFIIELDHPSKLHHLREELESQPFYDKVEIKVNEFIAPALAEPMLSEEQKLVIQEVLDWSSVLKEIPNAVLNSRGTKHMERYIACLPNMDGVEDELINSKVLPRILFSKKDTHYETAFDTFINRLPVGGNARVKAEKMKKNNRVVQFWR